MCVIKRLLYLLDMLKYQSENNPGFFQKKSVSVSSLSTTSDYSSVHPSNLCLFSLESLDAYNSVQQGIEKPF